MLGDLKTVVERTVHLQLQRTLVPLFATPVVSSSILFVGGVSALIAKFLTAIEKSSTSMFTNPFLNSLLDILARALSAANLRMRVHVKMPIRWRHVLNYGRNEQPRDDGMYTTPRAEAKYWRVAGRYRRRLYGDPPTMCVSSEIPPRTTSRDGTIVPLVTYYTPRLLPLYRERCGDGKRTPKGVDDAQESRVSPKTFCKWHRMVFQNSRHPTLAQAAVQMKYYSNRDLFEIQRIARLLSDEEVFRPRERGTRKASRMTKYSQMWQSWLNNKGMDLVVVFE